MKPIYKKYNTEDEWESYMGNVYSRLIGNSELNENSNIVELGPGFKYKMAYALKRIGYKGNIYLIDVNEDVIKWLKIRFKEIIPEANVIGISKSFRETISLLPKNIDVFLSNHPLDDMIINEFLSHELSNRIFGNERNYADILEEKWKSLSEDENKLKEIYNVILNDFNTFYNTKSVKKTIIGQYKRNDYSLFGKEYLPDKLTRGLFNRLKMLFTNNDEFMEKALDFYNNDENPLFKDETLLSNTQNPANFILGEYKKQIFTLGKNELLKKLGQDTFLTVPLYKREVPYEPVYINEKVYELVFNEKYEKKKAYDKVRQICSVTLSETNQKVGLAFVDKQKDPLNIALNGNLGSGRAFYFNDNLNFKGEKTPLATSEREEYSNGFLSLSSALHEAIISEVISEEIEPSCFKTLAVLDKDAEYEFFDSESRNKCGIIIRVDEGNNLYRFSHRFQNKKPFSKEELFNIARQMGKLEANKYMKRFIHGAWSAGNISIDSNMIDFDTSYFTETYAPQFTFTDKYITNYFGFEHLGDLKILESVINSDLNLDNTSIKELEKVLYESKYLESKKLFLEHLGFNSGIYENNLLELDELFMLFEKLSKLTFPNYQLLNSATNPEFCNIFNFSHFFKHYPLYYKNENLSFASLLTLLMNPNSKKLENDSSEHYEKLLGEYFVSTEKDYLNSIYKATDFIKKFIKFFNKTLDTHNFEINEVIRKALIQNDDKRYLFSKEEVKYDLVRLYEENKDIDRFIKEIIAGSLTSSSKINTLIFEGGVFNIVLNNDNTHYFEFISFLDIENLSIVLNDEEYNMYGKNNILRSENFSNDELLSYSSIELSSIVLKPIGKRLSKKFDGNLSTLL